jgi:hypothetical protein
MRKNMTECKFTDDTKRLMVKSIGNNEKLLRMFGFNLCLDQDNNIQHGNIFEGREGYIDISQSVCSPTTKEIGTFYSHPSSDPTPSMASIIAIAKKGAVTKGHELLCVGTSSKFDRSGPIDRKVTCFELKNKNNIDIKQVRKITDSIASENISPAEMRQKAAKLYIKEKCVIEL